MQGGVGARSEGGAWRGNPRSRCCFARERVCVTARSIGTSFAGPLRPAGDPMPPNAMYYQTQSDLQ